MKHKGDDDLNTIEKINIDEESCIKLIFSFDLRSLNGLLARHLYQLTQSFYTCTNYDHIMAIQILINYLNTHDFKEFSIKSKLDIPFPYFPTALFLSDNIETKREFNYFINECYDYYIKDITIINWIYEFVKTNDILDYEINNFIYYLIKYYNDLNTLFNNTIKDKLSIAKLKVIDRKLINFEYESIKNIEKNNDDNDNLNNDVFKYNEKTNTMLLNISEYDIYKVAPIIFNFYLSGEDKRFDAYLGDINGPIIGETVDLSTLFPFNVTRTGNIINNIKWG